MFRLNTELCCFIGGVDFHQNILNAVASFSSLADFFAEIQIIDCVNEIDLFGYIFHLVRLQMTDEMPMYSSFSKSFVFFLQFLNVTFTKIYLTRVDCFFYQFYRKRFRNRNKLYAINLPSTLLAGLLNAFPQIFEVFSNHSAFINIKYTPTRRQNQIQI